MEETNQITVEERIKKLKVYLNGRFLGQSITGVQRYALELIRKLDELLENNTLKKRYSFTVLTPSNLETNLKLKNISLEKVGRLKGHLWEQTELPFYSRRGILINLCNTAPLFKVNQVVTIHDASIKACPSTYSWPFRIWYSVLFNIIPRFSKKIVTDSLFSKNELIKYFKIESQKIQVIYLGKEHVFNQNVSEEIIVKHDLKQKPYVLAVSSLNPQKNFKSIVNAVQLLDSTDFNIVIAGGTNPSVFNTKGEDLPKNIIHLGYVSDSELRALYENAFCFIFPSYYEGFGLPPLEAMACGCPVLASNQASMPEVCGDAAIYFNPSRPNEIANGIKRLKEEKNLIDEMCKKGVMRAEEFSWEKCAAEILDVIEGVARG